MWLSPGQTNGLANPVLILATYDDDGVLADVFDAAFQILDPAGDEVVPRTDIDLEADRLAVGQYVPPWAVAGDADLGQYTVRLFVTRADGDAEVEYRQSIEVSSLAPPWGAVHNGSVSYVTLERMRAEGIAATILDARVVQAVKMASRRIDELTRNFFSPRRGTLTLDGSGLATMKLPVPIIALESVTAKYVGTLNSTDVATEIGIKVFNRHLRGLSRPDDRKDPRIEVIPRSLTGYPYGNSWSDVQALERRWRFPAGPQNVVIKGIFGYTDSNGSPLGEVPDAIQWATVRLARRYLPKQANAAALWNLERSGMVTSETTRDQSYSIGEKMQRAAPLTGDVELDDVLMRLRAPAASLATWGP